MPAFGKRKKGEEGARHRPPWPGPLAHGLRDLLALVAPKKM